MLLKITPKQRTKINTLVRRSCCNCCKGNCLLLDDGAEAKCVQLISRYGIYCNYFLKAVLPAEKELYAEILQQNGLSDNCPHKSYLKKFYLRLKRRKGIKL